MPTEPQPVTLSQVVRRAVEVVDPTSEDAQLGDLEAQFEDDDQPITAIDTLDRRLATAAEAIDPDVEDPAVSMAVATVLYLAHRRDHLDSHPDDLLRLAARAEWKDRPPAVVADWLAERGID